MPSVSDFSKDSKKIDASESQDERKNIHELDEGMAIYKPVDVQELRLMPNFTLSRWYRAKLSQMKFDR